jgi:hypothetical protein
MKTNVDPGYANFMSYPLVERMTWQGRVLDSYANMDCANLGTVLVI